jgi:hypothetical protein
MISPSFSKIEKPLISPPKKKESFDSKFNSQKNIKEFKKKFSDFKIEFHQKKTSEFSDTDSISPNFPSSDKLNHMNCSVLTKTEKQEDLLMTLISKIENPELKEKYLKNLKKTMIKDVNKPSKSKISLDETLEEFSKQNPKLLLSQTCNMRLVLSRKILLI